MYSSYTRSSASSTQSKSNSAKLQELAREVQRSETEKNNEISRLRTKVYKLEDEVDTLQETVSDLKDEEGQLKRTVTKLTASHKEELENKENEIKAERKTVSELRKEVLALRFELAAYRHETLLEEGSLNEDEEKRSNLVADYDFPDKSDLYLPRVLLNAARKGLSGVVRTMLEVAPRKERVDLLLKVYGDAALEACAGGHYDVAKALIEEGANVNSKHEDEKGGRSLLHYAVVSEHESFLELLLKHPEINSDVLDARGRTPLHLGARLRKSKSVKLLISNGVDLSVVTPEGHTAHELASNDNAGGFSRDFYSADRIKQLFKDRSLLFWNTSTRALRFYKQGVYSLAMESFGEAVSLNSQGRRIINNFDFSRLLFNKAKSSYNCGHVLDALHDLDQAIELKPDYSSAIELRAKCNFDLFAFDKAVADLNQLNDLYKKETNSSTTKKFTLELESLLQKAKKSRDASHYEVLGIRRSASTLQIKQAFRNESRKWHPDKQQCKDDAHRAKSHFQRINEGKMVLLDGYRRRVYDQVNGYDSDEDVFSSESDEDFEDESLQGFLGSKVPWKSFSVEHSISKRQANYKESEKAKLPQNLRKEKVKEQDVESDKKEPKEPEAKQAVADPPKPPPASVPSTTFDGNEYASSRSTSKSPKPEYTGWFKAGLDVEDDSEGEDEEDLTESDEDEASSDGLELGSDEEEFDDENDFDDSDSEDDNVLWQDNDLEASCEWLEARMKKHLDQQAALRAERALAEKRVRELQARWKQEREYLKSCGIESDIDIPWSVHNFANFNDSGSDDSATEEEGDDEQERGGDESSTISDDEDAVEVEEEEEDLQASVKQDNSKSAGEEVEEGGNDQNEVGKNAEEKDAEESPKSSAKTSTTPSDENCEKNLQQQAAQQQSSTI